MASIISVDTLQDSAGSNEITTANVKTAFDDRVKAWCNWNGTGTIAINDSNNVSSITDNGTGITTANYTNDMANGNYANGGAARENSSGGFAILRISTNHNAGSTRWVCENEAGTQIDGEMQTASTHGDLA